MIQLSDGRQHWQIHLTLNAWRAVRIGVRQSLTYWVVCATRHGFTLLSAHRGGVFVLVSGHLQSASSMTVLECSCAASNHWISELPAHIVKRTLSETHNNNHVHTRTS